jgi:hypothetical protein
MQNLKILEVYGVDLNKPYKKQIKPFNFMLIGLEKNGIIPCLPYDKNIK